MQTICSHGSPPTHLFAIANKSTGEDNQGLAGGKPFTIADYYDIGLTRAGNSSLQYVRWPALLKFPIFFYSNLQICLSDKLHALHRVSDMQV